jgi:parallel beta-helix repeat protein
VLNTIAGNTNLNVQIDGAGTSGNVLAANYIGTDGAGGTQIGDVHGVDIENGAAANLISSNTIGGSNGVHLTGGGTNANTLQANHIGTNTAGTALLLNGGTSDVGVHIDSGAAGNLIGGSTRALGNVLTGLWSGLYLNAATSNVIENNLIGTNGAGTAALGQHFGVSLSAGSNGNQILNNLVSGNRDHGVEITDSNNTTVAGNFIGTNAAGTSAVGNGDGVVIQSNPGNTATGNVIGGTTAAARNVISGNAGIDGDGLTIATPGASGNLVEGNYIGTAADGTANLGNDNRGVFLHDSTHDNLIGGTTPGAANVIAFNGDDGVLIGTYTGNPIADYAGPGNAVLGNSIFSNGKIGIDLGPDDGVTPNNTSGLLLNSPTLSGAAADSSNFVVVGNWQSNAFTAGTYLVQVYTSPTANPSGHGEGKVFLGEATVSITQNSNPIEFVLPNPLGLALKGQALSVTITDPFNTTSEFSNDVTVS